MRFQSLSEGCFISYRCCTCKRCLDRAGHRHLSGRSAVEIDSWGIDVAFSGTQKALSCPPGLSPLTVSDRALEAINSRKAPVANWYLDLTQVVKYWGKERTYHHTAPINMNYGLREALRLIAEEGLEERFARHRKHAELLWSGLEAMELELHVQPEHRLPTLTTVKIPASVTDEAAIRQRLRNEYNIEIAGGLGPLKSKVWRIGLMGFSSRRQNVTLLLQALRELLANLGEGASRSSLGKNLVTGHSLGYEQSRPSA